MRVTHRSSRAEPGPPSGSHSTGANLPGYAWSSAWPTACAAFRCPPPVSAMTKSSGTGVAARLPAGSVPHMSPSCRPAGSASSASRIRSAKPHAYIGSCAVPNRWLASRFPGPAALAQERGLGLRPTGGWPVGFLARRAWRRNGAGSCAVPAGGWPVGFLARRAWRKNGAGCGPHADRVQEASVSARIAAEQTALPPGCPGTGRGRTDHEEAASMGDETLPGGNGRADAAGAAGIVVLAHGGSSVSRVPTTPVQFSVLRMIPIADAIRDAVGGSGIEVRRARFRLRGWNGADAAPVRDLTGPVDQLAGRRILLVHASSDHICRPAETWAYAERARSAGEVATIEVRHGDHGMLRRARLWHAVAAEFARVSLRQAAKPGPVADAFARAAAMQPRPVI